MNITEFFAKYSIRLVTDADTDLYQKFIKEHSMNGGLVSINMIRTESLMTSFHEQGLKPYPIFMLDNDGKVCGFFSFGVKKALIDGKFVEYGYLSDLRLDTKKMTRTLVEFRKIYRDFIQYATNFDEFKNVKFFTTSVFADNEDAMRALGRGRSGVVYSFLDSIKTQVLLLHPGCLFGFKNDFKFEFNDLSMPSQKELSGLSESPEHILSATDTEIRVFKGNKIVFKAFLAKPSKRILRLNLKFSERLMFNLKPLWLLNTEIDPSLTDKEYSECLRTVRKGLMKSGRVGIINLLLFKTLRAMPDIRFSTIIESKIFEVSLNEENSSPVTGKKINLEPFFL